MNSQNIMTSTSKETEKKGMKIADWELDFYSRPVLESDGKKRWELLISSTQDFSAKETFRWEKKCPADQVNSIWLSTALNEALNDAQKKGWGVPKKIRCWRSSMKTMVKKASEKVGIEVIESRRTFSLIEWLLEREREFYPQESGYITGPIAPQKPIQIINEASPLPEAIRGDAWSFSSMRLGNLREAGEWSIEFNSLIPIKQELNDDIQIPGLRLFSKRRALPLSAWLTGLEPVRLVVNKNQLLLEAGNQDRWLVTDMSTNYSQSVEESLLKAKTEADGIQFIAIQSSPDEKNLKGFWMLKDLGENIF